MSPRRKRPCQRSARPLDVISDIASDLVEPLVTRQTLLATTSCVRRRATNLVLHERDSYPCDQSTERGCCFFRSPLKEIWLGRAKEALFRGRPPSFPCLSRRAVLICSQANITVPGPPLSTCDLPRGQKIKVGEVRPTDGSRFASSTVFRCQAFPHRSLKNGHHGKRRAVLRLAWTSLA